MTDLLPSGESLSPRLRFLKEHRLHTRKEALPRARIGPANSLPWSCNNVAETISGFGDTEEDAIFDYCRITGLRHWKEADLQQMVTEGRAVEEEAAHPNEDKPGWVILED